ncbi:MAG: translocation/assembly module TamB domain-containing protein [Chitinophagaceae bacterium]
MNNIFRRTLKVIGWSVVTIVVLLLLVVVLIQVPSVQQFAKQRIVSYLNNKLGTKVAIGHLSIEFPKKIVLENVYFEDQQKDTLLAGKRLAVDISMFKLIKSEVEINDIDLQGIRANIYRRGTDSFFNYNYIVKAFTTPKKTTNPTDTTGMKIDIDHVSLKKILLTFRDDQSGSDVYLYLGDFEAKIKKFDPDHLNFNISKFHLAHVVAKVYQTKPQVAPKTEAEVAAKNTGSTNIGLKIGKLSLEDIDADYADDLSAMKAQIRLGQLSSESENIDLPNLQIALKSFVLKNTDAVITLGNSAAAHEVETKVNTGAKAQVSNPWRFTVADLDLDNNNIKFDNNQRPHAKKGMDYAHLDVKNLVVSAKELSFTPTSYSGDIKQLSFSEQCGINLKKLQTSFFYGDHGVQLKNLMVETDKTLIQNDIEAAWPTTSVADLSNHLGDMLLRINLVNSKIAFEDVLTFAPQLADMQPFRNNEHAVFLINTAIQGYLKNLQISKFEASGMNNTSVKLSGTIKGLPDPNKSIFDLKITQVQSSQNDLLKLLPPSATKSIRIPERLAATGFFKGSLNNFQTKLDANTSRGNLVFVASMKNQKSYNIKAGAGALDLGYILKQEKNIGKVSARIDAVGTGFEPKTMVSKVQMHVFSAYAQGYNYRDLNLHANLAHGDVSAIATMQDPNLSFKLNAAAKIQKEYPAVQMNLQLDSVNFQALHLYSKELKIHGNIVADFASTNPDVLEGNAEISNLIVNNAGKRYAASDTIRISATSEGQNHSLALSSAPLTAKLSGEYKLAEIGTALEHTINKYYQIHGYKPTKYSPQTWTLNATIHPSPLLFTLMPALKGSDSVNLNINFNSNIDDLKLAAQSKKLVYGLNKIDSLTLTAATGEALNYSLTLNKIESPQFNFSHTAMTGAVAHNKVTTTVAIKDLRNKDQYRLGGTLEQTPNNGFKLVIAPDILLDYDIWTTNADNYLEYSDAGLLVHNFSLTNGNQSLTATSTADLPTAPIGVHFSNFSMATITKIMSQDSLLAGGVINGTAELRNPTTNLVFTSDLTVDNLSYKQDTIGNLTLKVDNATNQTLAANVEVQGHGNDIELTGKYFLETKKVDMNLNLKNVALSSLPPFAGGQLQNADGSLRGQLAITGTFAEPTVNGILRFDSAHVIPSLLGARFGLTNDEIKLNNSGIHFNKFVLSDTANNTAVIEGDILTKNYRDFRFALNIKADNFQAINTQKGPNKSFYGKLNFSTKTTVRGDLNLPVINSYIRINKNTDFSYVLPSDDPEVQSRQGVVQFVDVSEPGNQKILAVTDDSEKLNSVTKGLDLTARIETDSAANFNIVIDERNGDALRVRGTAALEAGIDRSGKVSLTGTYVLQDGSYLLTLNFLKRQFRIKPGSSITWDGDPKSATTDITAIYVANTAPIDLVQNQLGGRSAYEINQYKQRIPFNVLLKMKGDLMKPQISFDIQLPEREADRLKDVDAKLQQVRADESELNKQVFALLLLGHFVNEDPLATEGTPTTTESLARESASRILTDQLNRLAGNLIKGVDLNFGVTSGGDYSTGELTQRTDLSIGASKRLLNDRLKVNVGSSFGLEGPSAPNQQTTNIAGDVSVDYLLTKDGRYIIRAYRRNDYLGVVDGQVIEMGATFLYKIDFDNFNEFFKKPKKKNDNLLKKN